MHGYGKNPYGRFPYGDRSHPPAFDQTAKVTVVQLMSGTASTTTPANTRMSTTGVLTSSGVSIREKETATRVTIKGALD